MFVPQRKATEDEDADIIDDPDSPTPYKDANQSQINSRNQQLHSS